MTGLAPLLPGWVYTRAYNLEMERLHPEIGPVRFHFIVEVAKKGDDESFFVQGSANGSKFAFIGCFESPIATERVVMEWAGLWEPEQEDGDVALLVALKDPVIRRKMLSLIAVFDDGSANN